GDCNSDLCSSDLKVTEQIPIRIRVMIGDAHHRTIEYVGGNSARLPIARSIHAGENAPQAFENELIHEAAAVVADINDQAFFANLREKLFNECIEATVTHIGQVDVSHPPIRGSTDFF